MVKYKKVTEWDKTDRPIHVLLTGISAIVIQFYISGLLFLKHVPNADSTFFPIGWLMILTVISVIALARSSRKRKVCYEKLSQSSGSTSK